MRLWLACPGAFSRAGALIIIYDPEKSSISKQAGYSLF
jgi:RNA polymerase subunit RPABC4/transcription elongation factor Spt4